MTRIFLTGATGSIGGAVLAGAVAAGHSVTALVRRETAAHDVTGAGATAVQGDLADPEVWAGTAASHDVVVHLANSFDDKMAQTEPRLIDALRRACTSRPTPLRLIYTGGGWLYGPTHSAVAHEGSPFNPPETFRWAAEVCADLPRHREFDSVMVHPAMVYDTDGGGVFARYLSALRQRRPPSIWGDGRTRWPLIHRDDAAAGYLALIASEITGAVNLVAERGVTATEITDHLRACAGLKAPASVLPPRWVLARHGPWAEGPMLDQQMRSTRMAESGWHPHHADFRKLRFGF